MAFNFDIECKKAFETLKSELTTYPVLRLYNPAAETELHTDASSLGLAAILLQKQTFKEWAPVAYFSQTTNQAESRYHSFELEMLAVIRAIERFHIYLYGLDFTVITDCNALVHSVNKANLNPRIARWMLRLQNYKFKVAHRAGRKMTHVDALSRLVNYIEALPLERELEYKQLSDNNLRTIAESIEVGENSKFQLIEGLVYKKGEDKPRFVVPESMVINIIRTYHDEMAHCGPEKTFQGIFASYWFPSMRKKIVDYIGNCLTCLVANSSSHNKEGEMQITDASSVPLQCLHIDHFGPLPESDSAMKHILVVVDAFTRFTWLFPTKSTNSKEVIKHLESLINVFGKPEGIVTDRGTAFTSKEFAEFIEPLRIKHRLIAVAAPWANGTVERVNRFLKSSLKKVVDEQQQWKSCLGLVQYVINNTIHASTKTSPSKLLLGYDQRNHSDTEITRYVRKLASIDVDLAKEREENRDVAVQLTKKLKEYNKTYYDKRHKAPSKYNIGDYVLIRDGQIKTGESRKLKANYKGPYVIAKILNKNRYVVQDIPGFNLTAKMYNNSIARPIKTMG